MFIVSLLVEKISELIVNLGWEKTTKVVKEHIGKKNNIYIFIKFASEEGFNIDLESGTEIDFEDWYNKLNS
jgi:hypothetical protein